MNDYERVANVIRFLDRHHIDQPDLNKLAAAAGLSPFHFHRLFSTWAGVTPKDFLQCLTLEHVKQLLIEGNNVFDAALDAGLSGPGRLHDLCVALEAASPGEMKNGGAGMQIDYGFAETPFGEALIAETKRGVCHLSFLNGQGRNGARDFLMLQWPNAKLHRNDARIAELSTTIFTRRREGTSRRPLRAFVRGDSPKQSANQRQRAPSAVRSAPIRSPSSFLVTASFVRLELWEITAAVGFGNAPSSDGNFHRDNIPSALVKPIESVPQRLSNQLRSTSSQRRIS